MAKTELAQQTDRGRPAQYKQPSRKGKKSWRKNIDLSATEAALEDIREQERAVGAPAYTQANDQLFVEDRRGQETQLARQAREKRKLKSQEILEARSAVPAIHQRARSAFQLDTQTPAGKANAAGLPAKVKRRLRILASRPHEGQEGQSEIGSAGKLQSDAVLAEKRDLWASEPAQPANEWVSSAASQAIHVRTPHSPSARARLHTSRLRPPKTRRRSPSRMQAPRTTPTLRTTRSFSSARWRAPSQTRRRSSAPPRCASSGATCRTRAAIRCVA